MAADGALDLGGTEVVAADDDYVVNTAGDPVVAVLVASAAVAAEVLTREPREVGVEKPLMITVHAAHLAGPCLEHAEISGNAIALDDVAFVIDERRLDAKKRQGR